MSPAEFFYINAGFSYSPNKETEEQGRRRCAQELADAEHRASEAGWSFEWVADPDTDSSDWPPYALWGCIARDQNGEVRASLWGIDLGHGDPWDNPYHRVVEAELALEAME